MKNVQGMIKKMQKNMEDAQNKIKSMIVEGSAGGDMVIAKVNGNSELISLKIEKEVVNPDDIEMLQDLIVAAVNDAVNKAGEKAAAEMEKVT